MTRKYFVGSLFLLSVAVSVLLLLLPLPVSLMPLRPFWPVLVLLFWLLERPEKVPLGFAFLLGLVCDVLIGPLLGGHALRLIIVVFIISRIRLQLRFFPMWQQMLVVFAVLVVDSVLDVGIHLLLGDHLPPVTFWLSPLIGASFWPFVFLLLDDFFIRLRIRDS